jgi:hypothetical protein
MTTEIPEYIAKPSFASEKKEVKETTNLALNSLKEDIPFSQFLNNLMNDKNFDDTSKQLVMENPKLWEFIVSIDTDLSANINSIFNINLNTQETQIS